MPVRAPSSAGRVASPRSRRAASLVVAVLAAALGLSAAACSPGAGTTDEVVFWAMGSEAEAAAALLRGFREQNPTVPVRVQAVPWSAAHEKLLTAFVGGSMPDVFQLGNTWVPELAALGALEPLEPFLDASGDVRRDAFFDGAFSSGLVDGRTLALPWYVDARVLFYRRDLLAAAGMGTPPRTWEEWVTAMRRVRQRAQEDGVERYGVFLPVDEWQTPVSLALQRGASLLADDDTRGRFSSPEVRAAFEFYASLFADGLAPTGTAAQLSSVHREFERGFFAFLVTGPWNLVEIEKRMPPALSKAWATAPLPAPVEPGVGVSVAGGASLAVSASSPRKQAAWKLVQYLVSIDAQVQLHRTAGDLPARRDAWEHEALAGYDRAAAFRVQLEHLAPAPRVPEWERIASKVSHHLERVVRGLATMDEATGDLDADVDAILAKRRAMRGGDAR